MPRSCVFSMTCNDIGGFLTDPTGNRRYWPVTVTQAIDPEKVKASRDQLWAEAFWYFQQGVHWWPDSDHEHALCQQAQEAHYLPDSVEEDLFIHLTVHPFDTITTKEIQGRFPDVSTRRINSIMLNRFKCRKAEKLAVMGAGRGTRKGFEINRDVIPGTEVRIEESPTGVRVGKVTDLEARRKHKLS